MEIRLVALIDLLNFDGGETQYLVSYDPDTLEIHYTSTPKEGLEWYWLDHELIEQNELADGPCLPLANIIMLQHLHHLNFGKFLDDDTIITYLKTLLNSCSVSAIKNRWEEGENDNGRGANLQRLITREFFKKCGYLIEFYRRKDGIIKSLKKDTFNIVVMGVGDDKRVKARVDGEPINILLPLGVMPKPRAGSSHAVPVPFSFKDSYGYRYYLIMENCQFPFSIISQSLLEKQFGRGDWSIHVHDRYKMNNLEAIKVASPNLEWMN